MFSPYFYVVSVRRLVACVASKELIDFIADYLEGLKGIDAYVIASEGLPIRWSRRMYQEEAEEMVAMGDRPSPVSG